MTEKLSIENYQKVVRGHVRRYQQEKSPFYEELYTAGVVTMVRSLHDGDTEGHRHRRIKSAIIDKFRVLTGWRTQTPGIPETTDINNLKLAADKSTIPWLENIRVLIPVLINKKLDRREQHIIKEYFYKGLTLKEIAENMGISENRVCQLLKRSLKKIS